MLIGWTRAVVFSALLGAALGRIRGTSARTSSFASAYAAERFEVCAGCSVLPPLRQSPGASKCRLEFLIVPPRRWQASSEIGRVTAHRVPCHLTLTVVVTWIPGTKELKEL
jgi:hypothetical protein